MKVASLIPNLPSELHLRLADLYSTIEQHDKAYAEMQAYVHWARSFLLFHTGTHPHELAEGVGQDHDGLDARLEPWRARG